MTPRALRAATEDGVAMGFFMTVLSNRPPSPSIAVPSARGTR
jgi:hypothetical protein